MALKPRQMLGLGNTRPSMQYQQLNQAFQSDPRRILGQTLMGQGASSAPVRTPLQGLGRLSSALVGAYLQRKAGDAQVERESEMTNQIMGMLPADATAQQRAFAAANPAAFAQIAGQAQFMPTNAAFVRPAEGGGTLYGTRSTSPFGPSSETVSGFSAAPKPKVPVQMFNRKTREVIPVIPGSAAQTEAFKLGFEMGNLPTADTGFMFNDQGKQVIRPRGSAALKQAENFTKPIIKDLAKYKIQINALKNGATSANQQNAAGDAGLIFQFFTALDPGSRVTDGEVQLAKASQGYGEQFKNEIARVWKSEGQLLGDTMRKQIVTIMRNLAENNKSTVNLSLESITPRVEALGFKPNEIVPDLNFLDFNLEQYYYGQPNEKKDEAIIPGQPIDPLYGGDVDPSLTNASIEELLQGLR